MFRIPLPNCSEVMMVVRDISFQESLNISENDLKQIVDYSERNLRRAILLLQHAYMTKDMNQIMKENWKLCISKNIVGNK